MTQDLQGLTLTSEEANNSLPPYPGHSAPKRTPPGFRPPAK